MGIFEPIDQDYASTGEAASREPDLAGPWLTARHLDEWHVNGTMIFGVPVTVG